MAAFGAASLVAMLHLPKWAPADDPDASVVSITAQDGAALKAAWSTPENWPGRCVLVLHGVGAARSASRRFTVPLQQQGYATLAPDSRAHGESGGDLITYGLLERYNAAAWVHWMRQRGCSRVFGHGESLGASVLLLANAVESEPLFAAIVADCPFADLLDTAEYRGAKLFPVPEPAATALSGLAVAGGHLYTRWWYGLNFAEASPEKAIAKVNTPVLLIHGAQDNRTPPAQSKRLHAANPQSTELWLVEGAGHVGSYRRDPEEYMRRVNAWYAQAP